MQDLRDMRADQIRSLYKALLEREADVSGLVHYHDSKLSIEQIESVLRGSPEFRSLQRKKGLAPLDIDFIEPGIAISGPVAPSHSPALLAHGITDVLDLSDIDVSYSTEDLVSFLKIKVPTTAIISVGDTKKCIRFVRDFVRRGSGKLLIAGSNGDTQAAGMMYLWYVANGMERDVAERLVASCRASTNIGGALLGPWHYAAAQKEMEA